MKIILDTNVLINGVQDENSHTYKIISACISGDIQAYASKKTQNEYYLLGERMIKDQEYLNILDDFYETLKVVKPKNKNHIIDDDHEDDKFLDVAEECQADYIVSADHHLLDLELFDDTKIVEPTDFWHIYRESENDDEGESDWKDWASSIGIG